MTAGRAALVALMRRYLGALLDPSISLLEVHKLTTLVEGFETPYGLELLATVHWVVTRELAQSVPEIAARVHDWNPRKRQFTLDQINLASERLREQGWA